MELQAAAIAAFTLAHTGLSALCLAMDRHSQQVMNFRGSAGWSRTLRALGWVLLALACVYCVIGWGASIGFVALLGMLSLSALIIVLLLTYVPRVVFRGALASGAVGLVMMVLTAI